ncbi:MAG TPA: hypothetical protein VK416_04875, partial [Thermoanaerobaculia bacterium]|nr:hypothetical protein [Thermoanaerobaculia bacterium]
MTTAVSINDPGRSLGIGQDAAGERRLPFEPRQECQAVERRDPHQRGDSPAPSVRDVMTQNVRSCRPEDTL